MEELSLGRPSATAVCVAEEGFAGASARILWDPGSDRYGISYQFAPLPSQNQTVQFWGESPRSEWAFYHLEPFELSGFFDLPGRVGQDWQLALRLVATAFKTNDPTHSDDALTGLWAWNEGMPWLTFRLRGPDGDFYLPGMARAEGDGSAVRHLDHNLTAGDRFYAFDFVTSGGLGLGTVGGVLIDGCEMAAGEPG